jgi:ADP-ribosyl-[dinitrogen reductase] hydrolase
MAVGDALGLPLENLSPRRGARLFPNRDRYYFFFGRGMFSDDTEHAIFTSQALLTSGGQPNRFIKSLGWRFRWWLCGLPLGTGKATLKAALKLWLGWSPRNSGVWSAGNGPAMRAPIIGVCYGHQLDHMKELNRLSTRMTHTDPQAEQGSLLIAQAAYLASRSSNKSLDLESIRSGLTQVLFHEMDRWQALLEAIFISVQKKETPEDFALSQKLVRGVTGYILHTVPMALHAFLRYPDNYRNAVQSMICCGGDTDTTAAIVGALVGSRVGQSGIPDEWLQGLAEWPRSRRWIERLGERLAEANGQPAKALKASVLGIIPRNLFFNALVLYHVFRRLLPPY